MKQFDFGKNWKNYSRNALTDRKVALARTDFASLLQGVEIAGRSFLDIGFGQGLPLLLAAQLGAKVVGNDINPKCADALTNSRRLFPNLEDRDIPIVIGSVLDEKTIASLRNHSPRGDGTFDIVYSWGVLHHTGNMTLALNNATSLVAKAGAFAVAIYNRHWTVPLWKMVKWISAHSPPRISHAIALALLPVRWAGAFVTTGKNPVNDEARGMDFYFDILDWVGGYPYEYASVPEMEELVSAKGFRTLRVRHTRGFTGCNEFVFIRTA